jgi:ribosomal protein S18 acetylase RimI-like enzyme
MSISITSMRPDQADEIGGLVYEAFLDIARRHNFEPSFESREIAVLFVRVLSQLERITSFMAVEKGAPVAISFLEELDEVGGVGPVAVAVPHQGRGLGRRVMEALLERSEKAGIRSIRLLQDAYNMTSFSLYSRLGFEVKDLLAGLRGRLPESEQLSQRVREARSADAPSMDELCEGVLGVSRRNETEVMARFAPPLVAERDDRIAGYLCRVPLPSVTLLGHAVAEDQATMRDLIAAAARASATEISFELPTSQPETLRWALRSGLALRVLESLMVRGEYQPPSGVFLPSAWY